MPGLCPGSALVSGWPDLHNRAVNLQRIIRSLHITTLSLLMVASSAVLWAGATPAQAVKGAGPVADGTYGFVAKVSVGETHSCTGALVSPQWVITATSCFASQGQSVTSGAPKTATTVTVGRTDLSGTSGRVLPVEWIHPHRDRDIVLVKLALRAVGITPAVVGSAVPAAGDALQVVGYGRTAEQWAPNRVHAAPVVAGAVDAGSFGWTGANGSDVSACQGDAGAPVLRTSGDRAELVGLSSGAGQGGCLGAAGDGARGGDAARVDDLASWIRTVAIEPTTSFAQYGGSVTGIGGYDLKDNRDQAVAFDYDHSGKLDHLLLYRPGSQIVFIVKRGTDGTYAPVFSSTTGIGGYDLKDNRDRIIAFDYRGSGKLDHLLLYRPGGQTAWILEHGAGNTFKAVFHSSAGIGEYDLESAEDQIIAFDYEHSGKLDHLLLYRPGTGMARILRHNGNATFTTVFATADGGIGGYDLKDAKDRIIAFDYTGSGKPDHLVLYRPGGETAWVLEHGAGNTFRAVFTSAAGIGGYDLKSTADQIIAYDYEHTGKLDHLLLYRPGGKTAWILKHGAGNSFTAVFHSSTGIGGYDLELAKDRIIAFDYRSTGGQSHLFAYRPGDQIAYFAGRALPPVRVVPVTVTPVIGPDSIVERFAYPAHFPHEYAGTSGQTDWGTEKAQEKNFELISGNGGIIWVSCSSSPENGVGVLKVFPGLLNGQPVVGEPHLGVMAVCFKVLAPTGWVKLRIPNVFEVQGDSRSPGAGHDVDATVVNVETGTERTKRVERDESEQFGRSDTTTCDASHPDYPENCSETLLELRVVS
ncbi:S1 family peptidase [Nonomuraea sp. NPDC050451]|uniref:S1 family peptidase n=1 Tax=Nonomuraea sp. NPDC050451 TaxID=3364364 RepID=UPI0037885C7F